MFVNGLRVPYPHMATGIENAYYFKILKIIP
jgi:hypothetical protein